MPLRSFIFLRMNEPVDPARADGKEG